MDWITGIQKAIDYMEAHLTEPIDYEELAARSYSSAYHFQRVFGILCGLTVGQYIRNRRLTLAGAELAAGTEKVIDVALKYGYESPDSFAKAFQKFHGILPSQARDEGVELRSFSRLVLKISLEGGTTMDYRIEEKPKMILTGYKRRFTGVPYGPDRERQEEQFFVSTRAGQWLLRGAESASGDAATDLCMITNVDDEGYDFYYAAELDQWTRDHLYDPEVTGFEFMHGFGFENVTVPEQTYAIFRTERQFSPLNEYLDIRRRIVSEWMPSTDWKLAEGPEIAVYYWYSGEEKNRRFIEIWLPVEK